MKTLGKRLFAALHLALLVFLVGVAMVVFIPAPIFGFVIVSAASLMLVGKVAYAVFGAIASISFIQSVVEYRKANPRDKPSMATKVDL